MDRLRPEWAALRWAHPEAQLDHFLATTAARPREARPHVLVATSERRPLGMLLARVERAPVLPTLPRVRRREELTAVVVTGGVSGDEWTRRALLRELAAAMDRGEFDAICLRATQPDGLDHRGLRRAVPALRRTPALYAPARWMIDLPESYERYRVTLSRNLRRARVKEAHALQRRYGAGLELVRHDDARSVEQLLADVETVAAASYQRAGGVGYDPAQHAPVVRATLAAGHCRAWVLRLDGRPAAFELGWLLGATYAGAFTAYDQALRGAGVGGFVEQAVLADLCGDPQVRVYDQGPEDYAYKRRLSNRALRLADVWAFSARRHARVSWLLRTAFEAARVFQHGRILAPGAPGDGPRVMEVDTRTSW